VKIPLWLWGVAIIMLFIKLPTAIITPSIFSLPLGADFTFKRPCVLMY
jgi:hypothetical protein